MRNKKKNDNSKEWTWCYGETPLGRLILTFSEAGLAALDFSDHSGKDCDSQDALPTGIETAAVKRELDRYFAGTPTDFQALQLDPQGTAFQRRVWQELRKIPRGGTISYKELARRVGSPKAARAVGQANALNPLPLVIPCHRVIAADGGLGGYSSGLDRKRWLLRHEGAL